MPKEVHRPAAGHPYCDNDVDEREHKPLLQVRGRMPKEQGQIGQHVQRICAGERHHPRPQSPYPIRVHGQEQAKEGPYDRIGGPRQLLTEEDKAGSNAFRR